MNTSVLVIEDDITYGQMLKDALQHHGYKVQLSFSATGGMDLIKHQKIDILLSDVNMPGVSGIELARQILDLYLDIPIVLITGINDLNQVRNALELGVSDYIVKPVKVDELPVVIERNLQRKRLESERLQENQAEILMKAIKALMRALDAKDHYTCGHSQRVVKLAMLMGDQLHLNNENRFTLQLAAYLHDIGKIGMPDSILKKADGLEDYELRKAKDHPVIGSQIIGEIEELSEVASIIRHHHERYDGTGYPDKLKGDVIPLFSRILAILDTYEALVSDRVYRKAVHRAEALEEIKKHAATQFDPNLVDIFVRVMKDFDDSVEETEPQSEIARLGR